MPTPLLIGGATTSRQHTAVKIAPEFSGATVHVLDASRAVDVVSSLLSDRQRDAFMATVRREQEALRETYGARREKPLLTLADARANHLRTDWDTLEIPVPWFVGRRVVEPAHRRAHSVHRLDVLLLRVGVEGTIPGDPRPSQTTAARRASSTTTPRSCSSASSARSD